LVGVVFVSSVIIFFSDNCDYFTANLYYLFRLRFLKTVAIILVVIRSHKLLKQEKKPMNNRETYQGEMEKKLQEWGAKLDELKANADNIGDNVRAEYDQQIQDLQAKKEDLEGKLAELKSTSDDAWASVQSGFQSAWDELSAGFEEAFSKFSKES